MEDHESHGERRRPRVVDKRVSARSQVGEQPTASEPPPRVEPPAPQPTDASTATATPAAQPTEAASGAASAAQQTEPASEHLWTPEQEEQARRLAQEVLETPSSDWVVNAAVTLANVAATKLEAGRAADAQVAIDALSGILGTVGPRLGDAQAPLRQTLAQLQMAFAQGIAPPAGTP